MLITFPSSTFAASELSPELALLPQPAKLPATINVAIKAANTLFFI